MSQWNEADIDVYLSRTHRKKFTDHTLVDSKKIKDALFRIRERGYALDDEEMEKGVQCVAALVRDHRHEPVGAVSISGGRHANDSGQK